MNERATGHRLIGREAEVGRALAALARITEGEAISLVIAGEPGIGKTSLARELQKEAAGLGLRSAWSWCWSDEEAPALWPLRQMATALGWALPANADIASAYEAIALRLREDAIPVVLFLDDAHAADEATLSVLNLLVRSDPAAGVGVVLAVCEEDIPQGSRTAAILDAIARAGERLEMSSLQEAAAEALAGARFDQALPRFVSKAIVSAAGGNPFLIEQIARELAAGGDLHRPDRSFGFKIPRGVDAILERQVARLSPHVVDVIEVAAVLGRSFSATALKALARGDSAVDNALDEAVRRGVIRKLDSLGNYGFTHVLVRELVYERLPEEARRRIHRAAAEHLEARGNPGDLHAIAHHRFKAGVDQDAAHAFQTIVRAAEEVRSAGATEEAGRLYYRAARLARAAGLIDAAMAAESELATLEAERDAVPSSATAPTGAFRKQGDFWRIDLGDSGEALVKDSVGMDYLARLLSRPREEIHCLDLAGASAGGALRASDAGGLLDERAKREYRQRLRDLDEEVAEATEFHDQGRLRKAEEEKQQLLDELARAAGFAGRNRRATLESERARVAVTRAIRGALRRVAAAHPLAGRHLDATIRTGTFLSYAPDELATPTWNL